MIEVYSLTLLAYRLLFQVLSFQCVVMLICKRKLNDNYLFSRTFRILFLMSLLSCFSKCLYVTVTGGFQLAVYSHAPLAYGTPSHVFAFQSVEISTWNRNFNDSSLFSRSSRLFNSHF